MQKRAIGTEAAAAVAKKRGIQIETVSASGRLRVEGRPSELSRAAKTPIPTSTLTPRRLALAAAGVTAMALLLGVLQFSGKPGVSLLRAGPALGTDQPRVGPPLSRSNMALADPLKVANAPSDTSRFRSGVEHMGAGMTEGTRVTLRSRTVAPENAALMIAPGSEPEAPPNTASAAAAAVSELYKLVMMATAQGQSEEYIDQLLNQAYFENRIVVPAGLIGADGRVDTKTILGLFIAE